MTQARSRPGDNAGRCEGCDEPATVHQAQQAVPVRLGGGIGWGTMWLCPACLSKCVAYRARVDP
jgi:hypothetical protein